MSADGVERELKFHVAERFVVPYLGGDGRTHAPGRRTTLEATYWDTPDLRLTRRGHSLRHRASSDGSEDVWTLKLAGPPQGGALARREVERPGAPDAPPAVLRDALRGLVAGRPLVPACRLRSDRETTYVLDANGERRASVDDDRVHVLAPDGDVRARFREVEVELAGDGDDADLDAIAACLQGAGATQPSTVSKVGRALGELAQRAVVEPLRADVTVEGLVAHSVRDALERLLAHDPAVRLELGPEGVHQARVATRRLRADLRTLRPLLDTDVVEPIRDELKWLGGVLGAVRDLDVLEEEVVAAAARTAEPVDVGVLVQLIHRHRAGARRALIDAMSSARYETLLERLEAIAAIPPLRDDLDPARSADEVARRLLLRTWKRLARLATGVDVSSPDAHWHEVRKKAKGVRYAAELLEPFLGAKAAKLAKASKRIQEDLGTSNDATNARHWLHEHATTPEAAYVSGRLASVFEAGGGDVRRRWKKTWRGAVEAAARI